MRGWLSYSFRFSSVKLQKKYGETIVPALSSSTKTQLIWAHGMFDSSKNFINLAEKSCLRNVVQSRLVDARNHGMSFHSNEFSFQLMADDLAEYIANNDLKDVFLMGHSMGGRTIMTALETHKKFLEDRVSGVIIVDIMPSSYEDLSTGPTDQMLRFLQETKLINIANKTYSEVEADVRSKYTQEGIIQTIMNNIYIDPATNTLKWCLNFDAIERTFPQTIRHHINPCHWKGPRKIIIGGKSKFTSPQRVAVDYPLIFDDFQIDRDLLVFKDSAHFVYAKESDRFTQEVANFIQKTKEQQNQSSWTKKLHLDETLAL